MRGLFIGYKKIKKKSVVIFAVCCKRHGSITSRCSEKEGRPDTRKRRNRAQRAAEIEPINVIPLIAFCSLAVTNLDH